jgi:L-asparaginase/Glu-tRNA(Gln) amidotransferase subunit D
MKGVKARLKLMALLGKYQDADIVKRFFKQSLL